MERGRFGLRWSPQEHLLRIVPWLLAFCGEAAGSLGQFRAPACELLNPVLAGHLVIPAAIPLLPVVPKVVPEAIPLPPVVPKPAIPTKNVAEYGGSVKKDRPLDIVDMQDDFEGSLNFAHPHYLWVNKVQQFSRDSDELVDRVPEVWWHSDYELHLSMVPMVEWGKSRETSQHTVDQDEGNFQDVSAFEGSESQWTKYAGSMCLGFALFLLLVCGLVTRGSRYRDQEFTMDSSAHSADYMADNGDGLGADDADISNWQRIMRALFRIGPQSQEFSGGLSDSQIQRLHLAPYCGSNQASTSSPFFCTICLAEVQQGEMLRKIHTCHHQFHSACVDAWLARSATCPLCRHEIVMDGLDEGASGHSVDEGCSQCPLGVANPPCSYSENTEANADGPVANLDAMQDLDGSFVHLDAKDDSDGTVQHQELPSSFPARSFESTSWSETGESFGEEWELVEMET